MICLLNSRLDLLNRLDDNAWRSLLLEMNFTLFISQKNMPHNLQLINLNINRYNKYLIVSNIARNSLQSLQRYVKSKF